MPSAGAESSSRLVVRSPGIRGSSPAEMRLVINAPPDQQIRHRHSPHTGMTPLDFSLQGANYAVDGLNAGLIGVAFHDTPFGAYPHGLALGEINGGLPKKTTDESIPQTQNSTGLEKSGRPRMDADQARAVLYSYLTKSADRFDLERDWSINVLRIGIADFKKYNLHTQPTSDSFGSGAFGLGDDRSIRVPNHNRYPFLFPNDLRVMSQADQFTPEDRGLVESALDKMTYIYEQTGMIPCYSAQSSLDVPARPVFLQTAYEWYITHPAKDTDWIINKFRAYMQVGADEHNRIWNNTSDLTGAIGTSHAVVPGYQWLRRAGDMDTGTDGYNSSRVMGWDRCGARFGGSEEAALPVDLNAILLRNKAILAFASEELGMPLGNKDAAEWRQAHAEMAKELHDELFDPFRGTYVDGDHEDHTRIGVVSLASAWSLLAEVPTGNDALSTIGQLSYLDSGKGLLTTSERDSLPQVSKEALLAAGVPNIATKAFHKLLKEHNWDARHWPLEEVAAMEGMIIYILKNDKGLNLKERLAINRFAQHLIHDKLEHQIDIYLQTGKLPEKMLANGEIDHGTHQYEEQIDGLGATAAATELDMDVFLPILYRSGDGLLQAIEDNQHDVDLTHIKMDVIRELQKKRSAESERNGQATSRQSEEPVNTPPTEVTLVTFPPTVFLSQPTK